jgi:TRAP-type C4-dicarboxylate transport system permease small subunit
MAYGLHSARWRDLAGNGISWIAFAAICAAMVLTVGDIVCRAASSVVTWATGVSPGWGLFGLVDLTQLAMMTAMPLAIAAAFFANSHIHIDLIVARLSLSSRRSLARLAAMTSAGLMGICAWTAWGELVGQLSFTTTSAALGIAYTWYWAPLIAGLALSVLGCICWLIAPEIEGEA